MEGRFRYYLTERPFSIGTFPNNGNLIYHFDYDCRTNIPGVGMVWGFVDYSKPLTEKEISDYELTPAERGGK